MITPEQFLIKNFKKKKKNSCSRTSAGFKSAVSSCLTSIFTQLEQIPMTEVYNENLPGKMVFVIKLRLLDGKIIPDYMSGPNIITKILINGKRKQESQRKKCDDWSWNWNNRIAGQRPRAKECRLILEAGTGKEIILPVLVLSGFYNKNTSFWVT